MTWDNLRNLQYCTWWSIHEGWYISCIKVVVIIQKSSFKTGLVALIAQEGISRRNRKGALWHDAGITEKGPHEVKNMLVGTRPIQFR